MIPSEDPGEAGNNPRCHTCCLTQRPRLPRSLDTDRQQARVPHTALCVCSLGHSPSSLTGNRFFGSHHSHACEEPPPRLNRSILWQPPLNSMAADSAKLSSVSLSLSAQDTVPQSASPPTHPSHIPSPSHPPPPNAHPSLRVVSTRGVVYGGLQSIESALYGRRINGRRWP